MAGGYERKLEIKYSVVVQICKAKHILFAETSELTTKRDKMAKWQEIFEHSVSIGGISATRNWSYLRDVYWPNIKRSTMTKVHRQGVMNRIDLSVLEILNLTMLVKKHGRKTRAKSILEDCLTTPKENVDDSASVDEQLLPIKQESISFPNSPVASSHHDDDEEQNDYRLNKFDDEYSIPDNLESTSINSDPPNQSNNTDGEFKKIRLTLNTSPSAHLPPSSTTTTTTTTTTTAATTTTTTTTTKDEISTLRKRKLEEQVEYLRLQNVKARLEIKESEIRVSMLEKDLELKIFDVAEKMKK